MSFRVKRLDHLGIAVGDLADARRVFQDLLGLPAGGGGGSPGPAGPRGQARGGRCLPRAAAVHRSRGPHRPSTWPSAARGIHHVTLEVDDLPAALKTLSEAGIRLIDEEPRIGAGGKRIAFLHPKEHVRDPRGALRGGLDRGRGLAQDDHLHGVDARAGGEAARSTRRCLRVVRCGPSRPSRTSWAARAAAPPKEVRARAVRTRRRSPVARDRVARAPARCAARSAWGLGVTERIQESRGDDDSSGVVRRSGRKQRERIHHVAEARVRVRLHVLVRGPGIVRHDRVEAEFSAKSVSGPG